MMWRATKLGHVLTLQRGYDLPHKKREDGPYPIVSSSGVTGHHSEYKTEGPGVVTGRYGTLGEVFYIPGPYWPLNTALWVKDFKGNDVRFIFYLLQTMGFARSNVAGAVPGVNRNVLHAMDVRIPPLPIQRRIAGILSAYDDLIENNTKRIKILEEMAGALYREWFVHFRFPGHGKVKLVDSRLGQIPEGWEVGAVSALAEVHRGRSYAKENLLQEGGHPFLNLKNVARDGGFRRDGTKRYEGPVKERQKAKAGDIVMAVTDMTQERRIVARAARVPDLDAEFAVFSMDLVRIEPRTGVDSEYLYSFLRYSDFSDNVKNHAHGTNVLHLSPDRVREFESWHAPRGLCRRYGQVVRPMRRLADVLGRKNDLLREIRDRLIPRLISGEMDIDELKDLPEVAQ